MTSTGKNQQSSAAAIGGRMKLARNAFYSGVSSLADVFLLLLLVLAGRFLGAEQFGAFAYALSVTTLLTYLTNLGLDSLLIRHIAIDNNKADYAIGTILTWKLLITAVVTAVYLVIIIYVTRDETILELIFILMPASLLRSFNLTYRACFQGFEKFGIESVVVLAERLILFCVGFATLWSTHSAIYFAWTFFFTRAIMSVIYVVALRSRICRFRLALDLPFAKAFQIEAFPLGIAILIFGVYSQVDILMLGIYASSPNIGLFGSAQKIYEGCLVIAFVIGSTVYPRLSKLYATDPNRHKDLTARYFKYLTLVSAPLAATGLLFSGPIIRIFFGASFLPASEALSFLLIAAAFYFIVAGCYTIFRSMGLQRMVMRLGLSGLIVKVILNMILIPIYGIEGAAISAIIATIEILMGAVYVLHQNSYYVRDVFDATPKIVIALLAGMLATWVLSGFSIQIQIAAFGTIYVSAVFIMHTLDRYEIELLRNIFSTILRGRST